MEGDLIQGIWLIDCSYTHTPTHVHNIITVYILHNHTDTVIDLGVARYNWQILFLQQTRLPECDRNVAKKKFADCRGSPRSIIVSIWFVGARHQERINAPLPSLLSQLCQVNS